MPTCRLLRTLPTSPPFPHGRHFSASPPSFKIAPESPQFVQIPRPPRVPQTWKPYVKGQLPKPKTIFREVGPNLADPEQLPLPTRLPKNITNPPDTQPEVQAFVKWKTQMAESRRRNLREGIEELYQKKVELDKRRAEISAARNASREQLLSKKMREDVRLTLPSVLSTMRHSGRMTDPNRAQRIEAKKLLRESKEKLKREAQMEQIHDLYLRASNFILRADQLEDEIAREFVEEGFLGRGSKSFPMTVSDMLSHRNEWYDGGALGGPSRKTTELKMKVAAALTGGKLAIEGDSDIT